MMLMETEKVLTLIFCTKTNYLETETAEISDQNLQQYFLQTSIKSGRVLFLVHPVSFSGE